MKPRLLDLFSGAGGATRGYQLAGFHVTGVDIADQPNYPGDDFIQADALEYLSHGSGAPWQAFDAIHASPPCQAYSHALWLGRRGRDDHPRLIALTRDALLSTGLPYVIENVMDARSELRNCVVLCGSMVGLPDLERHRLFETNWHLLVPTCHHGLRGKARFPSTPRADGSKPPSRIVNQMASGTSHAMLAEAMGIDWIPSSGRRPTQELREAIPPRYTELIGHQLMQMIRYAQAA